MRELKFNQTILRGSPRIIDPSPPPGSKLFGCSTPHTFFTSDREYLVHILGAKIMEHESAAGDPIALQITMIKDMVNWSPGYALGQGQRPFLRHLLFATNNVELTGRSEDFHGIPRDWEGKMDARASYLDPEQRVALRHAIGHQLTLVVAPPGTGKTEVAYAFGSVMADLGLPFVFTAVSNKAVDVGISGFFQSSAGGELSAPLPKTLGFFRIYNSEMATEPSKPADHLADASADDRTGIQEALYTDGPGIPHPHSLEGYIRQRQMDMRTQGSRFVSRFRNEHVLMSCLQRTRRDPFATAEEKAEITLLVKRNIVNHANGIFVTLASIHSPLLQGFKPRGVILGEQSQPFEADAVAAMIAFNTTTTSWVLLGDDQQLPPTVTAVETSLPPR